MTHPSSIAKGARIISWDNPNHKFPHPCDLLMDAGILLALFDQYDKWYPQVNSLWVNHIDAPAVIPELYVNNYIIGEYLGRSVKKLESTGKVVTQVERRAITAPVEQLISDGVLLNLDSWPESTIAGFRYFETGADVADSFHIAEMYGWDLDLLTVDFRLAKRLRSDPAFSGRIVYVPAEPL